MVWKTRKPYINNDNNNSDSEKNKVKKVYIFLPRTYRIGNFAVPEDLWLKLKSNWKRDNFLDLARELKTLGNKGECNTNSDRCTWSKPQKRTGRFWNKRNIRDHPDYSIMMIGPCTENSPGYLRRLAVTQTLVRNNQLTLAWKTLKGV